MALVKCPDCGKDISDAAPACPNCGRPQAVQVSPQPAAPEASKKKTRFLPLVLLLVLLAFCLIWAIATQFRSTGMTPEEARARARAEYTAPVPAGPKLELVKSNWYTEYDYAIFEGQVKNISSLPLENVEAVVSFYDANNAFITSSDALIDFNPILPGQVSPFKVMKTLNPAMKKAGVQFKDLMGGTIAYREAETKKTGNK